MKKTRGKPFFHPQSLVDRGARVGGGTRVWAFAHVMAGAVVGADGNVGDHSFVESGARLGDRVTLKNGVSVWDGVTVEDDVFIGPNAAFTNDPRPVSRRQNPFVPTLLKKGACVGANATVVCGVTVGRYAFVGAGAVVTRDLPDHSLAYGNPARVQGYACECRAALVFRSGRAACRACGLRFRKTGASVRRAS
ncbi:MAG TPA: acyltransferase [Candidatus Eisenbacteria bacterium]|nr:acyltransferase [Candidatus Eisenbacteria bacterium]